MKKILLVAAIAAATSMTAAHAANTAVMKVQGKLTNASCTPTMSNGGAVDYGKISMGSLSATEDNQLGQRDITMTITCNSATKVGWTMSDNRKDSLADGHYIEVDDSAVDGSSTFSPQYTSGLGFTKEGQKIGGWAVYTNLPYVTVDGAPADAITAGGTNLTKWNKNTTGRLVLDDYETMSVAKPGELVPMAFTEAVFPMKVSMAIRNTNRLSITEDTELDGQATITLKYL
ncbi:DUF1120 domain-containing protein [Enterobacter ludwigii]